LPRIQGLISYSTPKKVGAHIKTRADTMTRLGTGESTIVPPYLILGRQTNSSRPRD
jgi:hypothetical protein